MKTQTKTHWFAWFGWYTDKLEAWLEKQAANGWHLVKADRWLLRFHFEKGDSKKVRYCVDYPEKVDDDYNTIFHDAGWSLIASDWGYYIWRAEYRDKRRPELFNDLQPLIERNNRFLLIFVTALIAQGVMFTTDARKLLFETAVGRVLIIPYAIVILIIVASIIAILRQNKRLGERKP